MDEMAVLERFGSVGGGALFEKLYGVSGVGAARERYGALVEGMAALPDGAVGGLRVFTAAGRTELGGNHTDHNRGRVLAASIQLDVAAVVSKRADKTVVFRSSGYPDVRVDLSSLEARVEERGTTEALVRGIASEMAGRGVAVGGFNANADSTVLPGSGLSSSAAVEALVGRIFDCLYGGGRLSALEIAQIGQRAENRFFGKPCGLMDQTACASGGVVAIDFADAAAPRVERVEVDPGRFGYALCVVDTKGSHANLTSCYAAIPAEMKAVAAFFGKEVLREVDEAAFEGSLGDVRETCGDRAVLRALHFFAENRRVDSLLRLLREAQAAAAGGGGAGGSEALAGFLAVVNESGDSSWELLQNVYPPGDGAHQGLSLGLAVSRRFFAERGLSERSAAVRVHGGGFAGTIQAWLPEVHLAAYIDRMERLFGAGVVTRVLLRPVGAEELVF